MFNFYLDILDFILKKLKIIFFDVCLVEEKNLGIVVY